MNLYERDPKDLQSQIDHYTLLRKQAVLDYYCRKEGYKNLGMHVLPTLAVSEHNAKEAIKMTIILKSLAASSFANETWTLRDTNLQLFNAPPQNCFKKGGFEVTVMFDDDPENIFPYTNWKYIYFQDDSDQWHKTTGQVDENGLYFEDNNKEKNYFELFQEKADIYSKKNTWTVKYNNEQFSSSIASSSRKHSPLSSETGRDPDGRPSTSTWDPNTSQKKFSDRRGEKQSEKESPSSTIRSPPRRRRRGEQQGESATNKRRRGGGNTESNVPTPEQVGSSLRSVARSNLSRLKRLQEEARDPPLILLKGSSNTLKCFRYRCNIKNERLFTNMSTVWHWVTDHENEQASRLLIAFTDNNQRSLFLRTTKLPKGCTYCFGQLNCL